MKKKPDKIIITIVIATILVLGYLIYFNIRKNTKVEVTASIKEVGANYVVIVDDENNEYLLNTTNEYNIGDKVNVVLKNVKKDNDNPATCDIVKLDTISKNVVFSITDIPEENNDIDNNTSNNISVNENNIPNENTTTNENVPATQTTDNDVINYLTTFSEEINNTNELKSSIKEKFVLIVDFLFYDGDIKGKTFKELSASAKLKVLQLFLKIDNKIEEKFPNYKTTISSTGNKVYTNVKTKALELYFDLTTELCQNKQDLCETAKEGLSDLKNNFSLTWEFIKQISGIGINKLKNWYEIWREV